MRRREAYQSSPAAPLPAPTTVAGAAGRAGPEPGTAAGAGGGETTARLAHRGAMAGSGAAAGVTDAVVDLPGGGRAGVGAGVTFANREVVVGDHQRAPTSGDVAAAEGANPITEPGP